MLIKAGVDISRLEKNTRISLNTAWSVFHEVEEELVITSTYEGNHSPGSLHYAHRAYDIRKPRKDRAKVLSRLKKALGKKYDVVNEFDHIHVEYDPK